MNNDYRLQLLSHSEIFPTKEEAMEYIEDNFKGVALWGEPALFFYGTEREPKMILAVGASHDTRKPRICVIDDAELRELIQEVKDATDKNTEDIAKAAERILNIVDSVGLTLDENKIKDQISYEPDRSDELIGEAQTVAEAIAIISTFVQKKFAEMELTVEDGESIDFTFDKTDDGSTLTGEVKISTEGSDDDLFFNNNIVGIKPDGIFASCNIEFDAERNQLIFTTSGVKNGRFVTDANKKIIDFGAHTIYVADNEDHNVAVTINQERGTISADVKISSDDDNLLVSKDGKMYVSGRAKDIKYKNTTVAAKLTAIDEAVADILDKIHVLTIEDLIQGDESDSILTKAIKNQNGGYTVTADVRLSSDESIQIGNGGIRANIDIEVDSANNKLVLKVGNTQKSVSLPGISILDDIYYDSVNKCIVITWKDGTQQTIIPVADMLKTWVVANNPSSPIVLTKSESATAGQPDTLSADIKLAPTDNLIGKDSYGQLYVKASDIDNKVAAEASARQAADTEINNALSNEVQARQAADAELNSAIQNEANTRHEQDDILKDSINAAREEAANALDTKATEIYTRIDEDEDKINQAFDDAAEAKSLVELTNANLTAEINRAQTAEGVNANAIANVTTRVTAVESGLATERETRSTADAVHDEQISNLRDAVTSVETSHQQDIERLSGEIADNASAISILNGSENTNGSVRETVKIAKDELTLAINNEKTRAEGKEGELASDIAEEVSRATAAEATTLANAKTYTDDKAAAAEHNANDYTDAAKAEAIQTSKDYTDEKVADNLATAKAYTDDKTAYAQHLAEDYTNAAKAEAIQTSKDYTDSKVVSTTADAKAYTDNAVANEQTRAQAAETANANDIVALKAKDIQIDGELANKIETVTIVKSTASDYQYILKVDGVDAGEINIPEIDMLQEVNYDPTSKNLRFVFHTADGYAETVINIADLVDTYLAGNGLTLTDNVFSVKINPASEFISVDENGIKVSGISTALLTKANVGDSYTKAESDAKYLTQHQDVSMFAEKTYVDEKDAEINTHLNNVEAKADENTANIAVINGNEAQEGSIKKALKDAKDYADSEVETEKNRAIAAETSNSDAIAIINGNESQEGSIKKALADAKAYTDAEVATENSRAVGVENTLSDAIAVINGNEAQEGSIKKALKDAKVYTDTAVADEKTAREAADIEINAAIDQKANKSEVYTKSEIEGKGYLTSTDIATLATKEEVNAENTRAVAAESNLATDIAAANGNIATNTSNIADLQAEAARLNLIVDETNTVKLIKSKDNTGTELSANVKLDATNTNIIKVSGNGIYADVEMSYSQATNKITFSNGLTTQEFELAGASLIEDGYYNSTTKQIVLITRLADGTTKEIKIDAEALIHTLKVDNGTNNPIKLAKTTDSDGVDVISARLDISTESHNQILNNNGTLYASNEASEHTALWNGTEKTLQEVIEILKTTAEEGGEAAQEIAEIKAELQEVERNIRTMESTVSALSTRVSENTTAIATNTGSINTLTTQVSDLNGRVTNLTNDFDELDRTVQSYEARVSALESDNTNNKTNIATLINEVDTMQTQLGDISGLKTVAQRLEELEEFDCGTY